jgi:hypothetical protein
MKVIKNCFINSAPLFPPGYTIETLQIALTFSLLVTLKFIQVLAAVLLILVSIALPKCLPFLSIFTFLTKGKNAVNHYNFHFRVPAYNIRTSYWYK